VRVKRIQAPIIAWLLLLTLMLPQLALAAGPGISTPILLDVTATTATIFWTTDTASDSRVNYGTTTSLGQTKYDSTDVTHHNIVLTGLEPGTVYFYEVKSNDERSPADPGKYYAFETRLDYDISLDPDSGDYGDRIEVTAAVTEDGTYNICWDSTTNIKETFTAAAAGSYTVKFFVPEDTKGEHTVYLTTENNRQKADAVFEVCPSVEIEETDPEDDDPMVGPVGTEVIVRCYGFEASQDIRLKFEGEVVETGTTDTKGSWTVSSYTIPATPGGARTFEVEAKEDDEWLLTSGRHFKVSPEITAPRLGTVGHAIEVKGTGFASEEEGIEITFRYKSTGVEVVVKENIIADDNGSWTAVTPVPALQGGTYIIDASGMQTRARDVDDIDFILGAGVLVEPISAYVGDPITVSGGGFAPGETGIKVTFDGQVESRGITAENDGTWETSFNLPTSTHGSHTVSASGDITDSVDVEEATLDTKARIEEFSPDEGAPGTSVSLTGSGFHGSQGLTVTVGGAAASEDMRTQTNGNVVVSFRVPKGSTKGTRKLVVTDEGGATDEVDFTVTNKILSTTPLPISPKDSTLRSGEVTFRWQGVAGSSGYTYTLEINTSPGSGNIFSKPGIEESSYKLTDTETAIETLQKGTYYWRVKIVDDYDNQSPWSDSIEFRVSPIPIWVWVVVGVVVLIGLMVVAYRETKFKVTE
jgi:hypothetical protein